MHTHRLRCRWQWWWHGWNDINQKLQFNLPSFIRWYAPSAHHHHAPRQNTTTTKIHRCTKANCEKQIFIETFLRSKGARVRHLSFQHSNWQAIDETSRIVFSLCKKGDCVCDKKSTHRLQQTNNVCK